MWKKLLIGGILGLLSGVVFGLTGVAVTGFVIIILDYCKFMSYKTIIGTLLFLNLWPMTIGSVWEFYEAGEIDYILGFLLLFTVGFGNWLGSLLAVGGKAWSNKSIKYTSGLVSLALATLFCVNGYYTKD